MKWYKIPGVSVTGRPFIMKVKAGNKHICLVSYDNELFALSARCPHAGADLSEGWCKNKKLICPVHRYSYDLDTGKGTAGQNDYVESYPVEIRDNEIYIGITSFWDKIKQAFNS